MAGTEHNNKESKQQEGLGSPPGSFSFRDNPYFPMHFGLVQWQSNIKAGERMDSRFRGKDGLAMDSRSPIGVGDKLRGKGGWPSMEGLNN